MKDYTLNSSLITFFNKHNLNKSSIYINNLSEKLYNLIILYSKYAKNNSDIKKIKEFIHYIFAKNTIFNIVKYCEKRMTRYIILKNKLKYNISTCKNIDEPIIIIEHVFFLDYESKIFFSFFIEYLIVNLVF